jgi:hypothetical protein
LSVFDTGAVDCSYGKQRQSRKKRRTEVFINSFGQEVTMTYNPELDNLPEQQLVSKKYSEKNRRRLNLKPPIDLAKWLRTKTD